MNDLARLGMTVVDTVRQQDDHWRTLSIIIVRWKEEILLPWRWFAFDKRIDATQRQSGAVNHCRSYRVLVEGRLNLGSALRGVSSTPRLLGLLCVISFWFALAIK